MRCPKCHYLSFDPEPRCRNCGYDLEVADADLALHAADSPDDDSVPDLTLRERTPVSSAPVSLELKKESRSRGRAAVAERGGDDRDAGRANRLTLTEEPDFVDNIYDDIPARQLEPEPLQPEAEHAKPSVVARAKQPVRAPHTTTEMPLFVKGIADNDLKAAAMVPEVREQIEQHEPEDVPVVPPTRPPLSVRRGAPEPAMRTETKAAPPRRLGPLDHDLLEDLKRLEREEAVRAREHARLLSAAAADESGSDDSPHHAVVDSYEAGHYSPDYIGDAVEPRVRLAAAGIDVAVLGGIAAFVFWATLRLCNVSVSDVGWAALVPFMIFIAVMDLSYLLMFTAAGGQTIGKMLMHIRVIGEDQAADEPVPMARAASRAVLTIVSVLALGLGWLPALFGRGLALHDRIAHTRVVRA